MPKLHGIILQIGDIEYPIINLHYKLFLDVDRQGWPCTPIRGGDLVMQMESSDDTMLLEKMIQKQGTINVPGQITVTTDEYGTPLRKLQWDTAQITTYEEDLPANSSLPMLTTLVITPRTLTVNHLQLDRRWPQTRGFWRERQLEEESIAPARSEEEKELPECTVLFRPLKKHNFEFGFDWVRTGDTGEVWYRKCMNAPDYDKLIHSEYKFFDQQWKQQYAEHKPTSRYIIPWVTLMKGKTARLRLKLEVNKPSGNIDLRFTGAGASCLSIEKPNEISAERTGNYFIAEEIAITCSEKFSGETYLEAWARDELVGKLAFVPNSKEYPIEVALIPVKLSAKPFEKNDEEGKIVTKTATIASSQVRAMPLLLRQAYIIPQSVVTRPLDLSIPEVPYKDFKIPVFDCYFRNNEPGKINDKNYTDNDAPERLRNKDIFQFLDTLFYEQYPEEAARMKKMCRVYFFPEVGFNKNSGIGSAKEGSALVYEGNEGNYTLTHEVLHVLGLDHTFEQGHRDASNYYYSEHHTSNLMDYVHPGIPSGDNRWYLWYWQIKKIWKRFKR